MSTWVTTDLKTSLTPLCSDVEVTELSQHLGIAARPPSPSSMLKALPIGERSKRDCSELFPDELVIVPSQLEDGGCTSPFSR